MSNAGLIIEPTKTHVSLGTNGFSYKKYEFNKTIDSDSTEFIKELNNKKGKMRFLGILGIVPSLLILGFIIVKCNEIVGTTEEYQSYATIQSTAANLRDKPATTQSKILFQSKKNDKFKFTGQTENDWLKIIMPTNDTAFVHSSLATVNKEIVKSETLRRFDTNPDLRYIFPSLALIPLLFWSVYLSRNDKKRKSIFITYELDQNLEGICLEMQSHFKSFTTCKRIWQIINTEENYESKRNGGVTSNIERTEIINVSSNRSPDPLFKTNVKVPSIILKNVELYFLPDMLLVNRNNIFLEVQYKDLDFDIVPVSFIEDSDVPSDATVTDHTYKHTNTDGGPDRRFSDNPRIPICGYTRYHIFSKSRIDEAIMTSKEGVLDDFALHIRIIKELQKTTSIEGYSSEKTRKHISKAYHDLLVEFSINLGSIHKQLSIDKDFVDSIEDILSGSSPSEFVSCCILFDLGQVLKMLSRESTRKDSIEMFGAILIATKLSSDSSSDLLKFDYETITKIDFSTIIRNESYLNMSNSILRISNLANPFESYAEPGKVEDRSPSSTDLLKSGVLFKDAARLVVLHQQASTSLIQRKLKLDYIRAGELMDQLEAAGIVGPFEGSKAREALIHDEVTLEQLLTRMETGSADYKPTNITFSLPIALKLLNHQLFDEYVATLNRFATIIAKADDLITKEEEAALKQIYQITHNPISGKENKSISISEVNHNETLDDVLKELEGLIGLREVKNEVNTLINFIQVQKEREKQGLKNSQISYHCVFVGSPGTGKTTIARIISKIYKHLNVLKKGHLVETDRSGLVAEYLGQTSIKVDKVVKTALDGILFIDEAYSLVGQGNDDYGKEAVAAIIKRMEDNRDKLVLIAAGYTDEMRTFIDTNPGFKSRFNRYIHFADYTPEELMKIFELMCSKSEYLISNPAKEILSTLFNKLYHQKDKTFGNGRLVRNVFEKTIENQSNRMALASRLTKELLITIEPSDVDQMEG